MNDILKTGMLLVLGTLYKPMLSQSVINGDFSQLQQVVIDYEQDLINIPNDTLYYPLAIRFTEEVKFNYDSTGTICETSPGCFGIRPFDMYQGYFNQEYLIFRINEPLKQNVEYVVTIRIKKLFDSAKAISLNPEFEACITNYPSKDGRIGFLEKTDVNSLDGLFLPISSKIEEQDFFQLSINFQAKGNENAIILGCFIESVGDKE